MENPDVSHDVNKKSEAIHKNQTDSFSNESIMHNHNEAEAFLKNLNDLSSNNSHLKRKREPELSFSIKEKNLNKEGSNDNILQTCNFCKNVVSEIKLYMCRNCQKLYHLECLVKEGGTTSNNQVICGECVKKENYNQLYNCNTANYFNNIINNPPQLNRQVYPPNLNIINELLKTNINRNFSMMPNPFAQQQSYFHNNLPGSFNNFQSPMNYNNMSNNNMMNLLQSGQMPLSQMNPQQLLMINQMLQNEKFDGQSYVSNVNNLDWQNNPAILNNLSFNQAMNTPINNNSNSNPDLIRTNLLNQLLTKMNKNVNPHNTNPINMSNHPLNMNSYNYNTTSNFLDNTKNNMFNNNQGVLEQQRQQLPQSSFLNLVTKQNNITNLNFFNNLFNISQMNSANPNANIPNQNSHNDFVEANLMGLKTQNNSINNYSSTKNPSFVPTKKINVKSNEHVSNSHFNNIPSSYNTSFIKQETKKIPVEDNTLLKNPDKYNIDIKCFERPKPRQLNIPSEFQNMIFTIWDFVYSFKGIVDPDNQLFSDTNFISDVEKFYEGLFNYENFLDIIFSLVYMYLYYSYPTEASEYENDKGLLFLRTIKENINTNLGVIMNNCWKEILTFITESKKFNLLVDDKITRIINKQKEISIKEESDFRLELEERISVLFYLVNSAMEISKIKDLVKTELEKKNNLRRERIILKLEYKNKDQRKKEIEKSEKFQKASQKIEELSRKLEEIELSNSVLPKILIKQKKEVEIEKERYISLIKEYNEIQNVKENIIERKSKIKVQLQDLIINRKRLIGMDAYKNEYYFFRNVTDKIYVRNRLDIENLKKLTGKESKWFCYDNKEEINEFIHKLLDKGIREKKLKNKLKKILNRRMNFGTENEQLIAEGYIMPVDKSNEINEIAIGNELTSSDLTLAVEVLKKMDEKFSDYLSQYSKQWEDKETREKWSEVITNFPTVHNLSSSLLMLAIRFKNPYRSDEPHLSENDIEEKEKNKIKFSFKDENNNIVLEIKAFDNVKYLAPKVKIWSKDLETFEMEKFFCESVLPKVTNKSKLFFSLHFFESVIFNLIKRRETVNKKNQNMLREIAEGNEYIINELENIENITEEKNKDTDQENNMLIEINPTGNEDKTISCAVDNDKTETIVITPSENNSEKKITKKQEENEIDKHKVSNLEANTTKADSMNIKKINKINTGINMIKKKKRSATPKDLTMTEWRDTCYICYEYGDLVCCDGCTNAAHLFCAYLEKLPDDWYCESCSDRMRKNKKNKKI